MMISCGVEPSPCVDEVRAICEVGVTDEGSGRDSTEVHCGTYFDRVASITLMTPDGGSALEPTDPESVRPLLLYSVGRRRFVVTRPSNNSEVAFWCTLSGSPLSAPSPQDGTYGADCSDADLPTCVWKPFNADYRPLVNMDEIVFRITSEEASIEYTDALSRRLRASWSFCGGYTPDNQGYVCPDPTTL